MAQGPKRTTVASPIRRRPPEWKRFSACAGKATRDHDPWSPPRSRFLPPKEAVKVCDLCPVWVACLAEGFELGDKWTVRAGLTPRQRQALGRPHLRVTCPSCGAFTEADTVRENTQVCVACGLSWLVSRKKVS